MLELHNITKIYGTDENRVNALKGINIKFPEVGVVSILGASGCGKTTLLNIIGGLDSYTSGDLIINGVSTKEFKSTDWNSYRNNNVGFVFQNYYLIPHLNVLENVMIAMSLSGLSTEQQKEKAVAALKKVGLADQLKKKPKQLSGGQAQRVAIARAVANNPKVILADEPTGALDSENSVQILELLREIGKESTVIIVTHNAELADRYSDRIINMKDGNVLSDITLKKTNFDTDLDTEVKKEPIAAPSSQPKKKKKKSPTMGILAALKTSIKNLYYKKGRTLLTAIAGCLGVVSISLILALNSGFSSFALSYQKNSISKYPLTVSKMQSSISDIKDMFNVVEGFNSDFSKLDTMTILEMLKNNNKNLIPYPKEEKVYIEKLITAIGINIDDYFKENDTTEFKKYIDANFKSELATVKFDYKVTPNFYTKTGSSDSYKSVTPLGDLAIADLKTNPLTALLLRNMDEDNYEQVRNAVNNINFWDELINNQSILDSQYKILEGRWPVDDKENNVFEAVLVVDEYNRVSDAALYAMGYLTFDDLFNGLLVNSSEILKILAKEDILPSELSKAELLLQGSGKELNKVYDFKDFIGHEFKVLLNTDLYEKNPETDLYIDKSEDVEYIKNKLNSSTTVRISGIVQLKKNVDSGCINGNIGYSQNLINYIIDNANSSPVVVEQRNAYEEYSAAVKSEEYFKFIELLQKLDSGEKTNETLTAEEKNIMATQSGIKLNCVIEDKNISGKSDYEKLLSSLEAEDKDSPQTIEFYPSSLEAVDEIKDFINDYNVKAKEAYKKNLVPIDYSVEYRDELKSIVDDMNSTINTITYVLIAVTCLALVVSLFMVAIIMYISVQDRTKEIGILRSLGARKLDIMNIFNTESMLLGFLSGVIGIALGFALMPAFNVLLMNYIHIPNLMLPLWWHAPLIIVAAVILTGISGLLPAIIASSKDPVSALRSE